MIEEWKDIEGYSGYQVSNLSRVRSFRRSRTTILRPVISKGGRQSPESWYLDVRLYSKYPHFKIMRVHVLVARLFLPNPFNRPFVNHINSIKTDNRLENLEWVTGRQNAIHYRRQSNPGKLTGVTFCKCTRKWRAQIVVDKKHHCLGRHNTQEEANKAYEAFIVKNNIPYIYAGPTGNHSISASLGGN